MYVNEIQRNKAFHLFLKMTIFTGIGGKDSDCSRTSCPACISNVQTWSTSRK